MRGEPRPGGHGPHAVSHRARPRRGGRDDARLGGAGLDPDLGRRLAHLAQHRVRDGAAAGRLLERGDVEVGDAVEVVLAAGELERRRAHRRPDVRARREQLERRHERVDLVVVDRHLQRHVVRKLREPADVADDERLAERERADRRAGRLAHRRRAEVDVHVARLPSAPRAGSRRRSPRARGRRRRARAAAAAGRGRSRARWRRRAAGRRRAAPAGRARTPRAAAAPACSR